MISTNIPRNIQQNQSPTNQSFASSSHPFAKSLYLPGLARVAPPHTVPHPVVRGAPRKPCDGKVVKLKSWTPRYLQMGVSKNKGSPKWMVYKGKLIRIDDLGVPLFLETPKCYYLKKGGSKFSLTTFFLLNWESGTGNTLPQNVFWRTSGCPPSGDLSFKLNNWSNEPSPLDHSTCWSQKVPESILPPGDVAWKWALKMMGFFSQSIFQIQQIWNSKCFSNGVYNYIIVNNMQHTYIILYSEKNRFHTPLRSTELPSEKVDVWFFRSCFVRSFSNRLRRRSGAEPLGSTAETLGETASRCSDIFQVGWLGWPNMFLWERSWLWMLQYYTVMTRNDIEMTCSWARWYHNERPRSNTLLRKTLFLCIDQTVLLWRHDEG